MSMCRTRLVSCMFPSLRFQNVSVDCRTVHKRCRLKKSCSSLLLIDMCTYVTRSRVRSSSCDVRVHVYLLHSTVVCHAFIWQEGR